jgi:predicted DNA-binding ribbon-helix-helix protein
MERNALRARDQRDGDPAVGAPAQSTLISGNVTVAGRRTSVRLEPPMWAALREVCARERKSLHALVTDIDRQRRASSLTAAIRVFLLGYFRSAASEDGHRRAGHGPVDHLPV